jgi:L-serine dehydratase
MNAISIFDIFKIGVGPSSSHTLGPWKAALHFLENLKQTPIERVKVSLYGSLSKTGLGHATDKAIVLGLMGYNPVKIDTTTIDAIVEKVVDSRQLLIHGKQIIFDYENDIVFEQSTHDLHPNTIQFTATFKGDTIKNELYASVGGGFIERATCDPVSSDPPIILPYPINTAADLLRHTNTTSGKISDVVLSNELSLRSKEDIDIVIEELLKTFLDSIYTGCTTQGFLPGGLQVTRRAKQLCDKLLDEKPFDSKLAWIKLAKRAPKDFNSVNKWISCCALAVNEENAAMGRIVTSPTNGAAGVIPAVLMYYYLFCDYKGKKSVRDFLFTAGEIGCLFKKGATISAALGGCQAEIGVSSAMAAAGLTEVLGGTVEQCLMAAEIAMEHHLGLTCDPVKGLVQIPCIERNAMGAIKAITAANLAIEGNPANCKVSLDTVIKTMWDISLDMNNKYKETAEGGLAIHLSVISPNC